MVDATGFYGAPVTKGLCALTLGSYSILNWIDRKTKPFSLTMKHITSPVHLMSSTILFSSIGEVICGLFLLYTFRQLERKMGSIKFASYTILSATLGLTIQLAFLVCFSPRRLTSGPLPIICSLLIPFFAHIPNGWCNLCKVFMPGVYMLNSHRSQHDWLNCKNNYWCDQS